MSFVEVNSYLLILCCLNERGEKHVSVNTTK